MEIIWYIIAGLISGVIAGMGMGGGTLLIPILTIFFTVNQHSAQGINLLAFIPCAVVSLIIHIKNKLVNFKVALPIILIGLAASVGSALLAIKIESKKLQFLFGCFLLLVGLYQLITAIISIIKNKRKPQIKTYKISFFTTKMFK